MPNITGQCLCGNIKHTIAGKPLAAVSFPIRVLVDNQKEHPKKNQR